MFFFSVYFKTFQICCTYVKHFLGETESCFLESFGSLVYLFAFGHTVETPSALTHTHPHLEKG